MGPGHALSDSSLPLHFGNRPQAATGNGTGRREEREGREAQSLPKFSFPSHAQLPHSHSLLSSYPLTYLGHVPSCSRGNSPGQLLLFYADQLPYRATVSSAVLRNLLRQKARKCSAGSRVPRRPQLERTGEDHQTRKGGRQAPTNLAQGQGYSLP